MIEEQLYNFDGEPHLIIPFKYMGDGVYTLKYLVYMMWYCFRTENKYMKEYYPKNLNVVIDYLKINKIDSKFETNSNVYESFEKIFIKYIIDTPKKYVSIKFIDDNEFVYLIKRDDTFQLLSANFISSTNISKTFKEGSHKDFPEAQECIFVLATMIYYDELNENNILLDV